MSLAQAMCFAENRPRLERRVGRAQAVLAALDEVAVVPPHALEEWVAAHTSTLQACANDDAVALLVRLHAQALVAEKKGKT